MALHRRARCSVSDIAPGVKDGNGISVVAGDVFWWMDDESQIVDVEKQDPAHSGDMNQLIASRKKILELADWVIPGHGKMFRVEK